MSRINLRNLFEEKLQNIRKKVPEFESNKLYCSCTLSCTVIIYI